MVELFFHLASKWPKWCAQTMHPFSQIATIFPRIGAPIVAVSALVGLVTLTFDPESGAHYCSWGGQSSYQFWCSKTFRSRLIGQHLSDTSPHLATLTFDFEGHGTCKNRARDPPLGAVILVKFHSVFGAVTPTL